MAMTFTEIKIALDAIATAIDNDRKRLINAKANIDTADADLGGLAAAYGSVGTQIDAAVAADPTNAAYLVMAAQWDVLVAEFQALKATSAAQKAALEAL